MKTSEALAAFAALAQETRLAVFRLLVKIGPEELSAGDIARRLDVHAATLSSHLAQLERADLLRSRRVQRHIYYGVDYEGASALITFLTEDCCQGHPDICGPAFGNVSCNPTAITRSPSSAVAEKGKN